MQLTDETRSHEYSCFKMDSLQISLILIYLSLSVINSLPFEFELNEIESTELTDYTDNTITTDLNTEYFDFENSTDFPNQEFSSDYTTLPNEIKNLEENRSLKDSDKKLEIVKGWSTWYNVKWGITACGTRHLDSELIAGIGWPYFTTKNPNNDPMCGRKIIVSNVRNGKTIQVSVWDKCESCSWKNIDLTPGGFQLLGENLNIGRVRVDWTFYNDSEITSKI